MTICSMNLLFQGVKLWKRNPQGLTHKMPRWPRWIQLLHLHLIGIQSQLPTAVELLHGRLHRLRCFKTSIALDSFGRDSTKCISRMWSLLEGDRSVLYAFQNSFLHLGKTLLDHHRHSIELLPTQAWQSWSIRTYLSKQSFQSFLKQRGFACARRNPIASARVFSKEV